MKTFKQFGVIVLFSMMIFLLNSCLGVRYIFEEYPDDGIDESDRPTITLTINLNGGTTTTPLEDGKLIGKYNTKIHIANPTKEGYVFTGWIPEMPYRFPEQDATYTATFNRMQEYAIRYELSGGVNNPANPKSYNIKSSEITLKNPTRQGYSFAGWYEDPFYAKPFSKIPSGSTGGVAVFAKWTPGTSSYRIEHWLQNANDNNYTISQKDTETKSAPTESITTATPKRYQGFVATNIEQKKVAGDGSTVVKVLYNRNIVEFTLNLDGGTGSTILRGKYGETVNAPTPTRQGYAFTGWRPALPSTFQSNGSYTATWKVSIDPTYKVEHWLQNVNDNGYSLFDTTTETKISSTGGYAGTAVKAYPGFTVQSIDQSKSGAEGNAVVKIYYNRNTIDLTFDLDGGSGQKSLRGRYGASTGGIANPTKDGYTFVGWSPALPSTFPATNTTYKAMWSTSTASYKVEHWQQNPTGNGYTILQNETETRAGTTGTTTSASARYYPGFTAKAISQATIAANGSTVVKVYYDRNNVELTLELNGGSGTKVIKGKYGASVTAPANPTKAGYAFVGWEPALPSTFPEYNMTYYAKWNTQAVNYKIEHWQQNTNGNGYTIVQNETETRPGTAGTATTATARYYPGFTAKAFSQATIAADGSTVVKIYYDRNNVELTFNLDGGSGMTNLKGLYGAKLSTVSAPKKTGYTFKGWSPSLPSTFPESNMTYTATWSTATASYKVEHWQQNANDYNYSIVQSATETKSGTTGTTTSAAAKTYQGFTAQPVTQETIAADGTTVVKIYYDRNIVELTFDLDGGAGMTTLNGAYGSKITAISTPQKTGYTFKGWSPSLPTTFPATNSTYKALWNASTANYKVEHWQQNANDYNYSIVQNATETKSGTAGATTAAAAKTYQGFTAQAFSQETIAADGTTVVKIYYDRNLVELTFDLDGGAGMTTLKGAYGSKITAISTPQKTGYTFKGWSPSLPTTFPATNATYKALWNASTANYKVEHWQQNADDDGYTLVQTATETKSGTAGATTNATARTYTGFYVQGINQTTIAADGSTVVQIYYNRNAADLNLDLDGGTGINLVKGRYGATVTPPPAPTKSGYTFKGWYPALPATFPAASQVHKAQWEKENVEADMKVEIYKEDFYSTKYSIARVRDVQREPALPKAYDTYLRVFQPITPFKPIEGRQCTEAEINSFKYIMLKKSSTKDRFDEYAVTHDGKEVLLGKNGIIMCLGDEGFLYLAGTNGKGTDWGTFFFTNLGYEKLEKSGGDLKFKFKHYQLTHDNVNKIMKN